MKNSANNTSETTSLTSESFQRSLSRLSLPSITFILASVPLLVVFWWFASVVTVELWDASACTGLICLAHGLAYVWYVLATLLHLGITAAVRKFWVDENLLKQRTGRVLTISLILSLYLHPILLLLFVV